MRAHGEEILVRYLLGVGLRGLNPKRCFAASWVRTELASHVELVVCIGLAENFRFHRRRGGIAKRDNEVSIMLDRLIQVSRGIVDPVGSVTSIELAEM